jgi:N-succinyldiaminopimelate aminotransferase
MSPPSQHASAIAWQDNAHVIENRQLYTEKFAAVIDILKHEINIVEPDAGFYLWLNLDNRPGDSRSSNKDWQRSDTQFAKQLYQQYNVTVLPGSYLSRKSDGVNPGSGFIRVALVADLEQCVDAAKRIRDCIKQ